MKEIVGDLFDLWESGSWIVVPTNGSLKKNGEAVMGAGVALQAKKRMPYLPELLGDRILRYGNVVIQFPYEHLLSFPVKHDWKQPADLALIEKSAVSLAIWQEITGQRPVFLPWVGCGNGGLDTPDVKPVLDKHLKGAYDTDAFIIVTHWSELNKDRESDTV